MSDPSQTPEQDPRLGSVLDGRYRLTQRLGAGGMGMVYKAEQVEVGRPVAVKFLYEAFAAQSELVARFKREAAAMSRLAHPHLTGVIDSGVQGREPYLVMDFHQGRSLSDLLDAKVPPVRAVGIARQILAGLRAAHAGAVVHRDLKPDNVMLLDGVEGDFVKILDFGLAKIVRGEGEDASMLTTAGFAMGTPGYMSPEQGQGGTVDGRTDLYSVGIMLYEMVVGRRPFVAEAPLAVLRMHMDDPPEPPRKAGAPVSEELERAILRALAKAPSRRWQTAEDFANALEATPEGRASQPPATEADLRPRALPPPIPPPTPAPGAGPATVLERPGRSDPPGREDESTGAVAKPRPIRVRVRTGGGWLGRIAGLALLVGAVLAWARIYPQQAARVKRVFGGAVNEAEKEWHADGTAEAKAAAARAEEAKRAEEARVAEAKRLEESRAAAKVADGKIAEAKAAEAKIAEATRAAEAKIAEAKAAEAKIAEEARAAEEAKAAEVKRVEEAKRAEEAKAAEAKRAEEAKAAEAKRAEEAKAAEAKRAEEAKAGSTLQTIEEDDDDAGPVVPTEGPGAKLEQQAAAPAEKPRQAPRKVVAFDEAVRLLEANRVDEAILALYAIRRQAPHSPGAALLLGHAYFRKLWRQDGLREYGVAINVRRAFRANKTLQHNAIAALDSNSFRTAHALLRDQVGAAGLDELRTAARSSRSPVIQRRAAKLIAEIGRGPRKRR
jgi:serine/threonine-protein kinase